MRTHNGMCVAATSLALIVAGCGAGSSVKDYTCIDVTGSQTKMEALAKQVVADRHSTEPLGVVAAEMRIDIECSSAPPTDKPYTYAVTHS